MSKELNAFKKIKKIYKYFVKEYRTLEPKLMLCEKEDFNLVENALKEYEKIEQIENKDVNLRETHSIMFSSLDKITRLVGLIKYNCLISVCERPIQCGGDKRTFYLLNIDYGHDHVSFDIEKEDYDALKEIQNG